MTQRLQVRVCILPCLGHHLLGPSQITQVGMPQYSCAQYQPFLSPRHGISISKGILWNNIKSPFPLGTATPGFVQSSRMPRRGGIAACEVSHSPLQGSLPEKFRSTKEDGSVSSSFKQPSWPSTTSLEQDIISKKHREGEQQQL